VQAVSTSPIHEIERNELSRRVARGMDIRSVMYAALFLAGSWLVLHEPASWRQVAMLSCLVMSVAVTLVEKLIARQRGLGSRIMMAILVAIRLATLMSCAVTGGLASPFMMVSLVSLFVTSQGMGPRAGVPLCAVMILGSWALALLQAWGFLGLPVDLGGPAAPAIALRFAVTWAACTTMHAIIIMLLGLHFRRAYTTMERLSEAREDALKLYSEQPRLVAALLGQLAHEVKNPMASVKGLASLVARDQSGKNAERMEVLCGELDHMQAALEELLNFSRPLGPLAPEDVDLESICASVARLHEGMLSAKALRVAVPHQGKAQARCDPRKVKQVMVNLLQNAIEASPDGETIEIQIGPHGAGRLAVSVLDRGKGLDPKVAGRLFQPGTTTKPRGYGLGLTIARTMALQHGGELAVTAREGGGCSATLVLPMMGAGEP
jgi:signal transduction histidine kinase